MAQNTLAEQVKFLEGRLDQLIKEYKRKRSWSRAIAYVIKLMIVVGGAATTILLGIKGVFFDEKIATTAAFIISAVLTAVSAFETFNDPYWKWIRYRSTLADLYEIKDDLEYLSRRSTPASENDFDVLFERLKNALKKMNQEWLSKRARVIGETSRPRKKA